MRLVCERDDELKQALRVQPEGMIHAEGASHLWDVLSGRLGGETNALLLDLKDVTYLSSAGIGTLVRLLSRVQQAGGSLAIYHCCSRVTQIVQVVGLGGILNVCADEAEARERLRGLGVH
jgi:anti-anti-sigma factor